MYKRYGKKGLMLEFLVRLMIAIIMITTVAYFAKDFLFRLSDEAEISFNELVDTIKDTENWEDEETRAFRLVMDKKSIVGIFGEGDVYFYVTFYDINGDKATGHFVLRKPPQCKGDGQCACLCKDYDKDTTYFHNVFSSRPEPDSSFSCEKAICREIPASIKVYGFPPTVTLDAKGRVVPEIMMSVGGVLFTRDVDISAYVTTDSVVSIGGMRYRSIYIEKYYGGLGVCAGSPCLGNDQKKIIGAEETLIEPLIGKVEGCNDLKIPSGSNFCGCSSFDYRSVMPSNHRLVLHGGDYVLFDGGDNEVVRREQTVAFGGYRIDTDERYVKPAVVDYTTDSGYLFSLSGKDSLFLVKYKQGEEEKVGFAYRDTSSGDMFATSQGTIWDRSETPPKKVVWPCEGS